MPSPRYFRYNEKDTKKGATEGTLKYLRVPRSQVALTLVS